MKLPELHKFVFDGGGWVNTQSNIDRYENPPEEVITEESIKLREKAIKQEIELIRNNFLNLFGEQPLGKSLLVQIDCLIKELS